MSLVRFLPAWFHAVAPLLIIVPLAAGDYLAAALLLRRIMRE